MTPSRKSNNKVSRKQNPDVSNLYDQCQTPPYALSPIMPYLKGRIWESACGRDYLGNFMRSLDFDVISTDILTGHNSMTWEPDDWDMTVTNPPYSIKFPWLRRFFHLGKPFAFLLPVEALGAGEAQRMFEKFGAEFIFMDKRIHFIMPIKGENGAGSWFPTMWVTYKFCIGRQITYARIERTPLNQPQLFTLAESQIIKSAQETLI